VLVTVGEINMKTFSILVSAVMAGALLAATVFAAPVTPKTKLTPAGVPNRAAAYMLATGK
jgi:hypothetical protein